MEKKYFAKFLPVEREIKKGDKAQYRTGEIISYDVQLNTDNLKKVKLFLCSRDIQVGDSVFEILSDKTLGDEFIWTEDINKYNYQYIEDDIVFKVIGEISPEAIWVKELMEFDEDEIEEWYWHIEQNCFALSVKFAEEISNKPPNFCKNTWENRQDIFKKGIYRIQCPCCKSFL